MTSRCTILADRSWHLC